MKNITKGFISAFLLLSLSSCKTQEKSLNIEIITDIHYAPKSLYSYTGDFASANDTSGTFKQIRYQEEILDCYIQTAIDNKADFVFVTGDMTFSGDIQTHEAFVEKMKPLIDANIQVLVIPGNHDFDQTPFTRTSSYNSYSTQISQEEFKTIYKDLGYTNGLSYDETSLSYSYQLSTKRMLIALDTITEYGYSDGVVKPNTMAWLEEQLQYAQKHNMSVIVMGHHNLFLHNPYFSQGYRLNNGDRVLELLEKYNVTLYFSGHMHIQSLAANKNINEILSSSFAVYPHHYGELLIDEEDHYIYNAKNIDMDSYYQDSNNTDLKDYSSWGYDFIYNNAYKQINFKTNGQITEEMNDLEALMNINYFMGKQMSFTNEQKEKLLSASPYLQSTIPYLEKSDLYLEGSLR